MTEKHKCQGEVKHGSGWSARYTRCGKTAKVEREGQHFCGIHDPVRKSEKREAQLEEWRREGEMRIAAYKAERAQQSQLEQDAARYRWLRTRDVSFEGSDGMVFVAYVPEHGHDGSRLDANIDTAMSTPNKGESK